MAEAPRRWSAAGRLVDRRSRLHTLISIDFGEAAQRHAVVFAVSQQIPEADGELLAHSGLEQLCREIAVHGAKTPGRSSTDTTTPEPTTTAVVPEDDAHAAEASGRPALPPSIEPAGGVIVLPHTARRRLRQAGQRPVPGLAEALASAPDPAACRLTRGAMHDYIRHRLLPGRRRELEDHLVVCAECTRAFTDVRESYWIQQAAAPVAPVIRLGTVSVPVPHASPRAAASTG